MVDWLAIPTVAAGANAIALAGNVVLTLWPVPRVAVLALALVGLGDGLVSGVTTAAVAVDWRRTLYVRMPSPLYTPLTPPPTPFPIVPLRPFTLTHDSS